VHTTFPGVWCEVALVAALAFALAGGCDWFNEPSQVNLSPETTIVSCPSGPVSPGDDVTIVWEGDDPDGQVIEYEWTLDDTLNGTTTEVTMLISEVEEGTHTFTVAAVDNDGEADASPARCTFTASLGDYVDRAVLCELMTTKICPNCWKADLMLERMLQEFGEDNVTVVSYHYDPPPDPLATAETSARCDWYYAFPEYAYLDGDFPTVFFDGLTYDNGAADTTSTKIAYRMQIEARLTVGSPVSIDLVGEIDGGRGSVTATVRIHHQLSDSDYTFHMMVIENGIWDGAHYANFVVRDIFEDEPLLEKAVGESLVVTREFTIGDWDQQHLGVVAFVQDDFSAEIIQSGRLSTR
jgi:hypothetical protein